MNNMDVNPDQSIIVIDAIKGFTSEGTFGEAFGPEDSKPIDETFGRLQKFIDANNSVLTTRCLVRSLYPAGKFVQDPKSRLFNLCIEGSDDLKDAIYIDGLWYTVQKAENDATTEKSFTDWIDKFIIEEGKSGVIVSGCTLTTCVSQTAMSMRKRLNDSNKEKTDIIAPMKHPALTHGVSRLRRSFARIQAALVRNLHAPASSHNFGLLTH